MVRLPGTVRRHRRSYPVVVHIRRVPNVSLRPGIWLRIHNVYRERFEMNVGIFAARENVEAAGTSGERQKKKHNIYIYKDVYTRVCRKKKAPRAL